LNLYKTKSHKKKRIDAVSIWLSRLSFNAAVLSILFENTIKSIKFIWTVVEKATTTLESSWIIIFKVDSTTPIIEKKKKIIINNNNKKYVIELKLYRGEKYYKQGLKQLNDYLDRESLKKGYLLIFNRTDEKNFKSGWKKYEDKDIFELWFWLRIGGLTDCRIDGLADWQKRL